jgi:transcriptional regulator with XRE-family HTH domain
MDFKDEGIPGPGGAPPAGPRGIGAVLRQARIAQGLSLFVLAHELNLGVPILEAVEAEDWEHLPPGRERPHIRQIADRLGVDLASFPEQWSQLPGAVEQEQPDPRREQVERILVSAISVGSLALLLWLVVPGPSLKRASRKVVAREAEAGPPPWVPKEPAGPYPVVGEVLPEVPVNEEGVLVSMRAMDACEAVVQGTPPARQDLQHPTGSQKHTLRVSEPWQLRVRGPFSIYLDNAGVVALEVAGRRIRLGSTVGEPWSGSFGVAGEYLVPQERTPPAPPMAPETDPSQPETEPEPTAQE